MRIGDARAFEPCDDLVGGQAREVPGDEWVKRRLRGHAARVRIDAFVTGQLGLQRHPGAKQLLGREPAHQVMGRSRLRCSVRCWASFAGSS